MGAFEKHLENRRYAVANNIFISPEEKAKQLDFIDLEIEQNEKYSIPRLFKKY